MNTRESVNCVRELWRHSLPVGAFFLLAAAGLSAQAQQAEHQLYGKMNFSLEMQSVNIDSDADGDAGVVSSADVEAHSISELKSNVSRIGVKGSYRQSEASPVTVKYQLEYETAPDDGDPTLKQRNSYVALSSEYGEVLAGFHDTPYKKAQLKTDLFNDTTYDIKELMRGENRVGPMLQYSSPVLGGGLKIKAAVIDSATGLDSVDVGLEESASVSAEYKYQNESIGEVQVVFAVDNGVRGYTGNRLGVQWKSDGGLQLGLLTQSSEDADDADAESFTAAVFSAAYQWNSSQVYLQTYSSDQIIQGGSFFGAGYQYKFDSNTKWYLWFGSMSADEAAEHRLDDDPPASSLATGFEAKF